MNSTLNQQDIWHLAATRFMLYTSDMMFIKDVNGVYLGASKAFAQMTGHSEASELIGKTDFEIFEDQELAKRYVDDDARLLEGGVALENYVEPITLENGAPRYCITSKYILRNEEGAAIGMLGVSRDITREYVAQRNYENELRNLFELPQDVPVAVLFDVTAWRIVDSRFRDESNHVVSRYRHIDEYIANALLSVVSDEEARDFFLGFTQAFLLAEYDAGKRTRAIEYLTRMPDDSERWVRNEFRFLLDPVTGNLLLFALLRDINEEKRAYSELRLMAETDAMTGLLNRNTLMQRMEDYLNGPGKDGVHALFFIDLDNFKLVNDTFGHQHGDRMLASAASAIQSVFRATDIVGRLGGDEFMVFMKDAHSERMLQRKAAELISALQFVSQSDELALTLTSSVGVALFRAGTESLNTLYAKADAALYQAKNAGKNRYCIHRDGQPVRPDNAPPTAMDSVGTVHLQTLLEYMDGGVVLAEVDHEIRVTYVSPSVFLTFGRTPVGVGDPGERLFSAVLPADLPELEKALFETAQSARLLDHSYRVFAPDGGIAWQHIRAKRLPVNGDGVHRLIAVITDVTDLQEANERLHETELRYRTAIEQTNAMLWEADVASRTLTLTGPAWQQVFGCRTLVFSDALEGFLSEPMIHPDSVETIRRMFADINAGRDEDDYYLRLVDSAGRDHWVKQQFRLQWKDGAMCCALGVALPVPNINAEMRRFEHEMRFADVVRDALYGSIHANLTTDRVESIDIKGDTRSESLKGTSYDRFIGIVSERLVVADDQPALQHAVSRQRLLKRFQAGEVWQFVDYCRIETDGATRYVTLFIKLMRHPISGDIHGFGYMRDNQARRGWELSLGKAPQRDMSTLLYTKEAMEALSAQVVSSCPQDCLVSVTVLKLMDLERVRDEMGVAETAELLMTVGRLCCIATENDVLIGRLDESHIVLLRGNVPHAALQQERIARSLKRFEALLAQAHPEAKVGFRVGYALESAAHAHYDTLLRKAMIACSIASQATNESVVAYADTDAVREPSASGDEADLMQRCRALELRCQQLSDMLRVSENDELTGVLGKHAFYRRVREALNENPDARLVIIRFDINRFKVFNEVNGTLAGDRLLIDIAQMMRQYHSPVLLCARLESDHFALLAPDDAAFIAHVEQTLASRLAHHSLDFRLTASLGVYRIIDPAMDVSLMCDRALLALRSIKSGFDTRLAYYDDAMRKRLLLEQQLVSGMDAAIENGQIVLHYQPQINYESGAIIGAEALVRWNHPTLGLLYPASFIPLFEQNGQITRLDETVWEICCKQLRDWIDRYPQMARISMSVNVSRLDIYQTSLCAALQRITKRYGLPASALKLEITESAYIENPQQLIDTVRELQDAGFIVEMDDFGSGFSSLNTLKDVPVDVLKLDMHFLSDSVDNARGGNILGSVIRMAHWLKLPLIAEGVETRAQADYLKSLGCIYMQGYLFDKPLPPDAFEELLEHSQMAHDDRYAGVNIEGAAAFWDPSTQMALLFNSFIGGAAIMEYCNGRLEAVRVNDNFYKTLGTTREAYRAVQSDILGRFEGEERARFQSVIEQAIATGEEQGCEVRSISSGGVTRFDTRNRVRLLAKNNDSAILYVSIEDISQRKQLERAQQAEAERNRLLMQTTGMCIFDYDCAGDILRYSAYIAGRGVVEREIPNYYTFIQDSSELLDAESADLIRAMIKNIADMPDKGEREFRADLWETGLRWCRMRYVSIKDDAGRVQRLVGQMDDIQRFKEQETLAQALRSRLNAKSPVAAFDDVVVNQLFTLLYGSSDVGGAIETTLELLGEHFGLQRVYIFEDDAAHAVCTNTFEWCAPAVSSRKARDHQLAYADFDGRDAFVSLFDDGVFRCTDIGALPPRMRAAFEAQSVHAMLQCAIEDNGVFAGFIGFDESSERAQLSDEQIGTLLFVSRIIGAFLLKLRKSDSAAFSSDFRAALDDNAAYLYIIDPDSYEIEYTNKAIRRDFDEDFIGRRCHEAFIGCDSPCAKCPVRTLKDPNSERIAEVERPDGMLLLSHASPLRWNGRDLAMLFCIDITESKKAERALITEKKKTDLAIQAANLTVWTYDMVNDTLVSSYAKGAYYDKYDTIPGSYRTVIARGQVMPESVDDYIALHERLQSGETTSTAVIRFDTRQLPIEWMQVTYTAIFDPDGQARSAIAIGLDVTQQKLAEERYRQESDYRKALTSKSFLTMRINVSRDVVEDVQSANPMVLSGAKGLRRDDMMAMYANSISEPQEREQFLSFFSAAHMLDAYARGEQEISLTFGSISQDGAHRFSRADVKLAQHPGSGDVIGFVSISDCTQSELIRLIMNRIIDVGYDYIASIDAQTGHFRLFASNEDSVATLPDEGANYDVVSAEVARKHARKGDVARVVRETSLAHVRKMLAVQGEYVCAYRTTAKTGARMRQLVFRMLDADGGYILLTRQDVTELVDSERRINEQLAEALDQARDANAAKSEFLSRISYDIRAPLNAIVGLASLALDEQALSPAVSEYLTMIDSSGRFLQALISDILVLSDIEKRIVEMRPAPYAYKEFIGALKATFLPLCREKSLSLHLDQDDLPAPFMVDKVCFNQIFFSVLTSAVASTPAGGEIRFTREDVRMDDGMLACDFVISNAESSVPLSTLNEQDALHAETDGRGLALSIARRIVDLMGGSITRTVTDAGAVTVRIRLTLPFAAAQHAEPSAAIAPDALRNTHILLADDSAISITVAKKLLESAGAMVSCVDDGKRALECFAASQVDHYDAILLDILMPTMDGLDAARAIRALPREDAAHVPIVALSANAFSEDEARSVEAGMNAHLIKPIDRELLVQTLSALIAARRGESN